MLTLISYSSQVSVSKVANRSRGGGVSSASMCPITFPQPMLIMLHRKNPKLVKGVGFYKSTNATSTLRGHITREGGEHYKYYCEMCKKNNILAIVKSPDVKEGDRLLIAVVCRAISAHLWSRLPS